MTDMVRQCSTLTPHLDDYSAVNFQNKFIYVTGGFYDQIMHKAAHRYSIEEDRWASDLPEMNEGRDYHASCIVRRKLFVFGGRP